MSDQYGLILGQHITTMLAELDEISHDLLILEVLELIHAPFERGRPMSPDTPHHRILAVGSIGAFIYFIDDADQTVTVAELLTG